MAPQLGNYVLETATAPGTGSFTLNGPETDRRSFSTAFPNGGSVFYFADDGSSAEWGVGTLTIGTPSTLSRTTIIGTTSGGTSALNFSGSVEVYNEIPAEYVPVLEQDGSLTLAGSLTVKGKTLVQNVDNFTSQEAIPAAQADGRYIQRVSSANTNQDFTPYSAGVKRSNGQIWLNYKDDKGAYQYAFAQPAGDYATNPALNTEITNRTNADTNLQNQINNRVLKTGDTSTGAQFVRNKYDNGTLHWAPGWTSVIAGMSGGSSNGEFSFSMWAQIQDGVYTAGIISLNGFKGRKDFRYNEDGNIFTPLGTVALTSQLPFTDQNLRVQVFYATVSDGGTVNWLAAFSGIPVLFLTNCYPSGSRITTVQPTSLTNTGAVLQVQNVSGDHTGRVTGVGTWFMVGGYF